MRMGIYLFWENYPFKSIFYKRGKQTCEVLWTREVFVHTLTDSISTWEMDRLSGGVDCMFTCDKLPEGNASVILSAAFFSFISAI